MLKSYLKVALRHLRRQKGYAFINIFGLALGLACCLLIGLYLWGELSYDRHHEHADQIYRVGLNRIYPSETVRWAPVAPAVAAGVKDAYPEVAAVTRLAPGLDPVVVRHGNERVEEDGVLHVDPSFFDVFSAPFLRGDPEHALSEPDAVVLTEETAHRYFGEANAVGETLVFYDTLSATVTGVVATPPSTSHFSYDFLRPLSLEDARMETLWTSAFFFYTYARLHEGASAEALEAKFRELERVHVGGGHESEEDYEAWLASGNAYRFFLQPLTDIHLHSDLKWEIQPGGDARYVYLFGAVALFILLIAVINFMNLATARSAERMREVGVRKVLGSQRGQLIQQFLTESMLMSLAALGIALALVSLAAPMFETIVGRPISLAVLRRPEAVFGLLAFTLGVGVLAGSYPAFYLSAFRPARVLKGLGDGRGSSRLRNGLVVTQFAIAVVLIVGTLVVYQQVNYMAGEKLDIGEDLIVVLEDARHLGDQAEAFQSELLRRPDVVNATYTTGVPSLVHGVYTYRSVDTPDLPVNMAFAVADEAYVETFDLELLSGRDFTRREAGDSTRTALLNETAVRMLGLTADPLGQRVRDVSGTEYAIIGVLKDFHFESLRQEIRPLILLDSYERRQFGAFPVAARIRSADVPGTLAAIEKLWTQFVPERPFAYSFLDDEYDALYAAERATGQLVFIFAVLAILVACLGLFGLAAFTAERRKKEIGIRKVIGAPVLSLVSLISREFVGLVIVGFAIAAPVAYFLMNRWLEDFAYRTELGLGTFAFAGGLALLIALGTVAYHALRAATSDPVNALRTE